MEQKASYMERGGTEDILPGESLRRAWPKRTRRPTWQGPVTVPLGQGRVHPCIIMKWWRTSMEGYV